MKESGAYWKDLMQSKVVSIEHLCVDIQVYHDIIITMQCMKKKLNLISSWIFTVRLCWIGKAFSGYLSTKWPTSMGFIQLFDWKIGWRVYRKVNSNLARATALLFMFSICFSCIISQAVKLASRCPFWKYTREFSGLKKKQILNCTVLNGFCLCAWTALTPHESLIQSEYFREYRVLKNAKPASTLVEVNW